MSSNWVEIGILMIKIKYVEWRNGVAYYRRRIPEHLQHHYVKGKTKKAQIFESLGTRDFEEAAVRAQRKTDALNRDWEILGSDAEQTRRDRLAALKLLKRLGVRLGEATLPDRCEPALERLEDHFIYTIYDEESGQLDYSRLPPDGRIAYDLAYRDRKENAKILTPTFSECVEQYLSLKPDRRNDAQFHSSVKKFMALNGDLPIDQYRRPDARAFIDSILKEGKKSATVKRYCAQVRPVFAIAINELEVEMKNPFEKITIPNLNNDSKERPPFELSQIKAIQDKCLKVGDDRRLLLALLSDTGMRLNEAVGLNVEDVFTEGETPFVQVTPNERRRLKTKDSERKIPLVGASLDASKRLLATRSNGPLFPTLVIDGGTKANAQSALLKKWLLNANLCRKDQSLHSFRHSLRDRLRNAGVPLDAAHRIGGWSNPGVGEGYGRGHDLKVLYNYMQQMIDYEQEIEI